MTPDQWPAAVPGPPPEPGPPPDTTDQIDEAIAGLDGLSDLPVADHVARFDAVHAALTNALSSIDKV